MNLKATLLKTLLFKKMKENETINEHINIFFSIVDKLKEMAICVTDDLLLILLLYSTPENYEKFKHVIEARDDQPKPDALKIKLLEEWEAKRKTSKPICKNLNIFDELKYII